MTEERKQMTLNRPGKMETVRFIVGCTAWVLGLLLAASDGPYMPWGNLLGIFIFLGASLTHLGEGRGVATHSEKILVHSRPTSPDGRCREQARAFPELKVIAPNGCGHECQFLL